MFAISRARDTAELVTGRCPQARRPAPTGGCERLAELDATAKQAAHETVFGRETDRECGDDHVTRASGAMERVHRVGDTPNTTT